MPVLSTPADSALVEQASFASSGSDLEFRQSEFYRTLSAKAEESNTELSGEITKSVLLGLLQQNLSRVADLNYSEQVKKLIEAEFHRINKEIGKKPNSHFDITEHRTRCDFRILCFSRVPAGVEHMEVGGIPRRLLFSGGLVQLVKMLQLLGTTRQFAPFLDIHLKHGLNKPAAFLLSYNRKSQIELYLNVASTLERHPGYLGLMATSWFYDPILDEVSPHLSFLRELMMENGAYLLRVGRTENANRDAVYPTADGQGM